MVKNLPSGFWITGLYPINREAVPEGHLAPDIEFEVLDRDSDTDRQ